MDNNLKPAPDAKNLDGLFVLAKFREEEAEKTARTNYSYWGSTFKTFLRSKIAIFSLVLVIFLIIFAFIQPYLPKQQPANYTYYLDDFNMWKQPPSAKHWFGTDEIGRDLWARCWNATRISMSLAFLVTITEMLIGIVVGTIWGYVRQLDRIMTEIYNLIANIPSYIILMLLTYIMSPSFESMYIAMSLTGWLGMAKGMRNLVLIIRDREYNMASRCLGTPLWRMITKNLLPQLISIIIMRFALSIPAVIGGETFLTFLGIGLPLEVPSLGVLINSGRSVFNFRPHMLMFPAIIVSILTITFTIAGNAFSDASDPRNHI